MRLRLSQLGGPSRLGGTPGFSFVELLIALAVSVVVIAGVYQLLIGQNRLYMKQREIQDVRQTLRAAANLLAFEFRHASPEGGDLYFITTDSFAVRSVQAAGIICAEHSTQPRYGIWGASGEFQANDSVLAFATRGAAGPGDDGWKVAFIRRLWEPVGGGVAKCAWGDTLLGPGKPDKSTTSGDPGSGSGRGVPDLVIDVRGDMDSVFIGAPVRAFRRVQYAAYQEDGRWWLGRRVGSDRNYELLTGPLRPPSDSGLAFIYYDSSGATTTDMGQVSFVDIVLRGESLRAVRRPGDVPSVQEDTLTLRVSLRG